MEIPETAWIKGGTPAQTQIIPWSVETLEHGDVDHWQGTLDNDFVATAVTELVGYLE